MSPSAKRRPWIRFVFAALLLTGVGLFAGTSTGRLQVYRSLFALGSPDFRIRVAEEIAKEAPEAALPIVLALLEDPEVPLPFRENEYLLGMVNTWNFSAALPRHSSAAPHLETLLINAALPDFGRSSETLPTLALSEALIDATASPRPGIRVFAICFLADLLDHDAALPKALDALRDRARKDPDPMVRYCALSGLSSHKPGLEFCLSLLEDEEDLLALGRLLDLIHQELIGQAELRDEQFDQILRALHRFWPARLRQAAAALKAKDVGPLELKPRGLPGAIGDRGRLRVFAWLRDHPEDLGFLSDALGLSPLQSPSPPVLEAALAFLRESRSPEAIREIAGLLCSRQDGVEPERYFALARELLASKATKARGLALLAASTESASRFRSKSRDLVGELLMSALADPALRRPFGHKLDLLPESPEAEALLAGITEDPDPKLRFFARCALIRRSKSAVFGREELLAVLACKDPSPRPVRPVGFTPEPPGPFVFHSTQAFGPVGTPAQRVLGALGLKALPALLPALKDCDSEELERVLPKIRKAPSRGNTMMRRLAREPGILGEKARALIEEE